MTPTLETGPQQGRSVCSVIQESPGCPWTPMRAFSYTQQHSGRRQDVGHRAECAQRRAGQPWRLLSPCWGFSGWSVACDFSECHFPSSVRGCQSLGQECRGTANRYSKILRPQPEAVRGPGTPTVPPSGVPSHGTFLPCHLLEASPTLLPYSTLVGPTGGQAVRIKGGVCSR